MPEPLIVVPTYVRTPGDLELTLDLLQSIRKTEPAVEVLLVDDASPAVELVDEIEAATSRLEMKLSRQTKNEGFARTVNVGLRRALEEGRDAILVNADMEFIDQGWIARMQAQRTEDGSEPAAIVGGLLLYPSGLIQHAGIFFSMLHRTFGHIYQYGPGDLPEAQHARRCPVTGALQFIRHECLVEVGLYDEDFRMGFEDVDYCIRAFQSGRECVYQPRVRAFHYESMFRGRPSKKLAEWQSQSWWTFMKKYRSTNFGEWVPSLV